MREISEMTSSKKSYPKTIWGLVITSTLIILISGCAVGPDYAPP
ncbi:hypothetical protein ACFL1Z_00660 [Thermodesulfobacteriota bacterium]